jgi:uncharacterized membrane protein YkoI
MKNLFHSIFKKKSDEAIHTRISRDDAIKIACEADIAKPHSDVMKMTEIEKRDGKIIWIVSSATVGRRIHVEIDDETGKVLSAESSGLR